MANTSVTPKTPANNFDSLLAAREDDSLIVRLPKFLRDKNWANSVGTIQDAVSRIPVTDSARSQKLLIDFTACRWSDPIPLLSTLIEIATAQHLGLSVSVRLPNPDLGPDPAETGPYQSSPNRLLRFLDHEGFLDCLDSLGKDPVVLNYPADCGRKIYRDIRVTPSYEDSNCIRMYLFRLPTTTAESDFASRSVDEVMVSVDAKLEAKVATRSRERLLNKLRVALRELVHNAQEHAYESEADARYMAIYVRYRIGSLGLDSGRKEVFQQLVREETQHCPGLNADWLTARSGCLEVFAIDRGLGMIQSFLRAGVPLTEKYKFSQVIRETYLEGRSTNTSRKARVQLQYFS